MTIGRIAAVFAVCTATLLGQVDAPSQRLRVATWNVLNLFDNQDHPTRPDEGTDPKSVAELKLLAKAIDALDADVLGVQEVENRDVLEALNRHLARPFMFVELIEGNDFRGIDVGLLSRVPIVSSTSHRFLDLEGEHRFARDFPLFRIRPAEGKEIDVGVVHLKSKRGKAAVSNAWRKAEATGIRTILERRRAAEPKISAIVMGDFNDTRGADTLKPVMTLLSNTTAKLTNEEAQTFLSWGGEQIDFILATPDLSVAAARVIPLEASPSDHRPVVVDFDLGVAVDRHETPGGEAWSEPQRPILKAQDKEALEAHLLKEVTIEGRVVKVHRPKSGRSAALNFHKSYKQAVTVWIPKDAFDRLPDLDSLVGKRVQVSGPISRRRGVYQIKVTRAEQLEVK